MHRMSYVSTFYLIILTFHVYFFFTTKHRLPSGGRLVANQSPIRRLAVCLAFLVLAASWRPVGRPSL